MQYSLLIICLRLIRNGHNFTFDNFFLIFKIWFLLTISFAIFDWNLGFSCICVKKIFCLFMNFYVSLEVDLCISHIQKIASEPFYFKSFFRLFAMCQHTLQSFFLLLFTSIYLLYYHAQWLAMVQLLTRFLQLFQILLNSGFYGLKVSL